MGSVDIKKNKFLLHFLEGCDCVFCVPADLLHHSTVALALALAASSCSGENPGFVVKTPF